MTEYSNAAHHGAHCLVGRAQRVFCDRGSQHLSAGGHTACWGGCSGYSFVVPLWMAMQPPATFTTGVELAQYPDILIPLFSGFLIKSPHFLINFYLVLITGFIFKHSPSCFNSFKIIIIDVKQWWNNLN